MTVDQAQEGAGEVAPKEGSAPADAYGICIARSRSKDVNGEYKTADGIKPLRKGWHLNPGATIPVKGYAYPKVGRFDIHEMRVEGLDHLLIILTNRARDPRSAVLRGKPIVADGKTLRGAPRLLNPMRRTGGNVDEPTVREVPRLWLAVDIDGIECPSTIDPVNEPDAVVEYVMSHLPPCFEGVSCVWQMSASAGILKADDKGNPLPMRIYIRLWFWLSRPLGSGEAKVLLAGYPAVDKSLYNAAQPHYIAPPSFFGMPDPVPQRWGLVRGHADVVEVPIIATPERRTGGGPGAGAPAAAPGLGYDEYRGKIGDHEGGGGFHGPTLSAVGAYFALNGSGADAEWLRANLENAIRAADASKHTADVVEDRIRALPSLIGWVQQRQADSEAEGRTSSPAAGKFLATRALGTPESPAPTLSIAEAREIAAHEGALYASPAYRYYFPPRPGFEFLAPKDAGEWDSTGLAFSVNQTNSTFWQWDVGVGKTEAAFEVLRQAEGAARAGQCGVFSVPQHKLTAELKERIEAAAVKMGLKITVEIYRGRNQKDPDAPLNEDGERPTMCPIRVELGDSVLKAMIPQEAICKTTSGEKCRMCSVETCGKTRQDAKRADVWIVPHTLLTLEHGRPDFIGRPRFVVVDENFRGAVAHGFGTTKLTLTMFEIEKRREVPDDEAATDALHEVMRAVSGVLQNSAKGPTGEIPMQVFIDAGLDVERMTAAVDLLYKTAAPADFKANDPDDKINAAAKRAADANGALPWVIRLAKIIKWSLARGDKLLRGMRIEDVKYRGQTVDAVRMRWFMPIHKRWDAPRLHLDATGRVENVRAIFEGLARVSTLRVRADNAYIRQIIWTAAQSQWDELAEEELDEDKLAGMTKEERAKAETRKAKRDEDANTRNNNVQKLADHVNAHEFKYRGMGTLIEMPEWVERERRKAKRMARAERQAAENEGRAPKPPPKPQTHWQIDVLVICQKKLEERLRHLLPQNVAIEHFGNLVGLDRYKEVPYCVVIGRPMPPPREAELQAEVLHDDYVETIGDHCYDRRPAAIRIYGQDKGPRINTPYHPDAHAEAVRWEICEGAVIQAIGRPRAPNRRPDNPCQIDVICDLALPIEMDAAIQWGEARKEVDLLTLAAKGFILHAGNDTAEWAWRIAPEIWLNAQAFRDLRRRGGERAERSLIADSSETTRGLAPGVAVSNRKITSLLETATPSARVGVTPDYNTIDTVVTLRPKPLDNHRTFGVFVARRALEGRRGHAQAIAVDLAQHPDPRLALEALVGPLASFEVLSLPTRRAYDVIHSGLSSQAFIERVTRFYAMLGIIRDDDIEVAPSGEPPVVPEEWAAPSPTGDLPPLVPTGRRFSVSKRVAEGWDRFWFFPDADGGIWTDLQFRRVEPPDDVREYAVAHVNGAAE